MTEIITCSKCRRSLQVPEHYLGQTVQCPQCGHQFTAASQAVSAAPPLAAAPGPADAPPRRWDEEDDHDAADIRRRRPHADDDDDDEFGPIRGIRQRLPPNRGGLIMALGLVSLIGGWMFCLPVVVGPVAWILAQQDLRAIRDGHMDPLNESMVRTGQVCGIISTIILVLAAGFIGLFILGTFN
jgi:hypothetical protein